MDPIFMFSHYDKENHLHRKEFFRVMATEVIDDSYRFSKEEILFKNTG
jgi:hypothetical protein